MIMLVKNWMSKPAVTVDVNDSMQNAVGLLKEHRIKMLPVTEKGKLAGIVTDRDLKRASASDATSLEIHELFYLLSKIKIKDIMTKNPVTVPPDYTVEETAELLLNHKISGVPVLDAAGNIAGVITQTDLFKVILSLSGFGKRGIQFAFELEDQPGSIKTVTDIIRINGGRLASILSSYTGVSEGYRKVYIRAYYIDRAKLPKLTEELRSKARLLYMVDHRENRREIYA